MLFPSLEKSAGLGYRVGYGLGAVGYGFDGNYRMKGHCLFIDNFYTSPRLLKDLLRAGTYCTATIRANRKPFPKK